MRISVRELKARTGKFMKEVEAGGEVILTKRGKPVARIVPLQKHDSKKWWDELKSAFREPPFKTADQAIAWMKGKKESS